MSLLYSMHGSAEFSTDKSHRFCLWRMWDDEKPFVMFIGLNPSTANELDDDPTIRRVVSFAKSWGYGGVYMTNLYSYVTAHPDELMLQRLRDVISNLEDLKRTAERSDRVIFAWGNFKEAHMAARDVIKMFPDAYCLRKNKNGSPIHPLYVKGDTQPVKFTE